MKTLALIIALLGATIVGLAIANHIVTNNWIETAHQLEIQQACDQSRNTLQDGGTEQHCGDLQTAYGIEYLCNSTAPEAYCWTEINPQLKEQ